MKILLCLYAFEAQPIHNELWKKSYFELEWELPLPSINEIIDCNSIIGEPISLVYFDFVWTVKKITYIKFNETIYPVVFLSGNRDAFFIKTTININKT